MTRIVKPELAQDLTDLFPVLEPRSISPDETSSTLQLTHPFLTGTHKFRLTRNFTSQSGTAVTTFNFIFPNDFFFPGYASSGLFPGQTVPDGFYAYFEGLSATHNDTVNHNLNLSSVSLVGGAFVQGPPYVFQLGIAGGVPVFVTRPILVPPFFGIQIAAEAALGAGKVFNITAMVTPHRLLDPSPNF